MDPFFRDIRGWRVYAVRWGTSVLFVHPDAFAVLRWMADYFGYYGIPSSGEIWAEEWDESGSREIFFDLSND